MTEETKDPFRTMVRAGEPRPGTREYAAKKLKSARDALQLAEQAFGDACREVDHWEQQVVKLVGKND